MKNRVGFSLIELIAAALISSFIAVSLVTIYSAANRHVFQNFRGNTVKAGVSLGIHTIRNAMAQATRIQVQTSETLMVVSNLDPSGCGPITSDADVRWYYFCVNAQRELRYETGLFAPAAACACPQSGCSGPAVPGACSGDLLAQNLVVAPVFIPRGPLAVQVDLHSRWDPALTGTGLASTQRPVDYMLRSVFSISGSN